MTTNPKEMPRCYLCDVPLGESNNSLYVDGQWVHYTCAFHISLMKAQDKQEKGE